MESIRSFMKVAMPHSLGVYVPRKAIYSSFDSGTRCFVDNSDITLLGFFATRIW